MKLTESTSRRVRCEVNPGRERYSDNPDPNVGVIAVLFKEILQQIPEGAAKELAEAYREGGTVVFRLRQSSNGMGFKTAARWEIEPSTPESGEFADWLNRNDDPQ
jgi:hypothetical protein